LSGAAVLAVAITAGVGAGAFCRLQPITRNTASGHKGKKVLAKQNLITFNTSISKGWCSFYINPLRFECKQKKRLVSKSSFTMLFRYNPPFSDERLSLK
jgi:hypothetical protein